MFASEMLDALQKWVCDLELSIFLVVVIARLCVVQGRLELSDNFDELSRLLCKLVLFTCLGVSCWISCRVRIKRTMRPVSADCEVFPTMLRKAATRISLCSHIYFFPPDILPRTRANLFHGWELQSRQSSHVVG